MIDELKAYRRKAYEINSMITIRQPTLDEISEYGEQAYFSAVKLLCSTPADRKVEIWDALHVYWETVDEYELFLSTAKVFRGMDLAILLPGLDFKSFQVAIHPATKALVLRNKDGTVIDRAIYTLMTDYLRLSHGLRKNVDVGYDDYTRDIMIEDERDEIALRANKPYHSALLPLISSLTNCADFKYRYDDVWTLPVGVFMDAAHQVPRYRNYEHLMHGIYSGCVDIKKLNKKELDWMERA